MATQNQQQLIRPRSELDLDLDLDWDLALAQAADFPFAEAQRRDRDAGGALSDWAAWKQDVEIPSKWFCIATLLPLFPRTLPCICSALPCRSAPCLALPCMAAFIFQHCPPAISSAQAHCPSFSTS